MVTWMAPLDQPPAVIHAWSNVAWHAPRTEHRVDGLWQLHAYGHHGVMTAHSASGTLRAGLAPGTVSLLPPGAASRYDVPGRARFSCLHLHLRLEPGTGTVVAALAMDDPLAADLVAAAAAGTVGDGAPAAASAAAWAALWRLALAARPSAGPVATVCAWIDARLDDPPSVDDLARRAGLSCAHLRRLFRAELGIGVKPWIQRRRAERARHLLAHTSRRVRDIAAELGIGDAQRFNKLLRRQFGKPPSRLRGP
jgi:AraC family transcriptional regulator